MIQSSTLFEKSYSLIFHLDFSSTARSQVLEELPLGMENAKQNKDFEISDPCRTMFHYCIKRQDLSKQTLTFCPCSKLVLHPNIPGGPMRKRRRGPQTRPQQ